MRVIHKKIGGSGVGAARNTALQFVTGDYILFVDNDDWLEESHVEFLYQALKEHDADISIASFTEFIDDRGVFRFHLKMKITSENPLGLRSDLSTNTKLVRDSAKYSRFHGVNYIKLNYFKI